MIKQLGLIGYPLTHSFSKRYFSEKFQRECINGWAYELYPLENIALLPQLLAQNSQLVGLNVTIPYKEKVLAYLDVLSEEAIDIGAVNCIKIENGKLHGYNTDAFGFEQSLKDFLPAAEKLKALIFGTGGAAKAVVYVLKKWNIPFQYVSRNGQGENVLRYEAVDETILAQHRLLINTTPLGMSPNIESMPPINMAHIGKNHFCFDLIYNPEQTAWLKIADAQGAQTKNGLEMLHQQAERAWDIWNK
jgi:shikimate dehydrogenase